MDDFLPVMERPPGRRLTVRSEGREGLVLRETASGFVLAAAEGRRAPPLRGLVDLHEGARHVARGLVVAVGPVEGGTLYEYKRLTHDRAAAPADWAPEAPEAGPALA